MGASAAVQGDRPTSRLETLTRLRWSTFCEAGFWGARQNRYWRFL